MPPGDGFEYQLRQEDRAVNFVYIDIEKQQAGIYLTDEINTCGSTLLAGAFESDTNKVTNAGVSLMPSFLNLIVENPDKGVVMIEGAADTDFPLYLEILKDDRAGRTSFEPFNRRRYVSLDQPASYSLRVGM